MSEAVLKAMEFGHPFRVGAGGVVDDAPDEYAPHVYHDDENDIRIDAVPGEKWSAVSTGYTGQFRYAGAVMHDSEWFGGDLARDVLAEPGVYVLVAVSGDDGNSEGWVVLRRDDAG